MDRKESLQNLGLSNKEAQIYLALNSLGKGSVLDISEQSGIKRPTAYQVLKELKNKNLIGVSEYRGVIDYRAKSPDHLKSYIQKQKKLMQKTIPRIQKYYDNQKKLRLRVFDNVGSIKTLLEKSLRKKSTMHIIGDEENVKKYLGVYWEFYNKRAGQLDMRPKFKSSGHAITLLVWENKIGFIKFEDNIKVFAFKNPELHHVYQNLWSNF